MKSQGCFLALIFLAILLRPAFSPDATGAQAEKIFPSGGPPARIHGIDVSHRQNEIDWNIVKASGVTFVIVKATEGIDYLDERFTRNWTELAAAGLIRGAYHFYISDDDPVQQAEWFVQNAGSFQGVLPPVLDVERAGHEHVTPAKYREKLLACIQHVEKLTGKRPILYSSPNFAARYLSSGGFGKYRLWIADYGVAQPEVPGPWQQAGWDFWQNTSQDVVPGITAKADRNVFRGQMRELLEMIE